MTRFEELDLKANHGRNPSALSMEEAIEYVKLLKMERGLRSGSVTRRSSRRSVPKEPKVDLKGLLAELADACRQPAPTK